MTTPTIRLATEGDVGALHTLLTELAAFEGGDVTATPADLARDGWGPRPLFEALLAEQDGEAVGLLVFFPIYSSWRGRAGVMIHDLFVRDAARGAGMGRALVGTLLALAEERGWGRLEVNVLEWNQPARRFYESHGLRHNEGWLGYRLEL